MINGIKHNYSQALHVWESSHTGEKERVQRLAARLYTIKEEVEHKAIALGYAQACVKSIPTCRGECCRFHFPKTFSVTDFLAIIGSLTLEEINELSDRILKTSLQEGQCALLTATGCFLSFKSRPMVCTNAYPCFAGHEYWEFKEVGNRKVKPVLQSLANLIGS